MRSLRRVISVFTAVVLLFATAAAAHALTSLASSSMHIGSHGDNVKLLQQNLLELALYDGEVDGLYGQQTAVAVRKLQASLGLAADGICGKTTIRLFNSALPTEQTAAAHAGQVYSEVLTGKRIGIDAGHQLTPDNAYEPISPGSLRTKARMSEGAAGVKTGVPEYEITLLIAKKLKSLLEGAGAVVVMTRTENDVHLSNAERAQLMNEANVDCWIRIHCDFSTDNNISGIHVLTPSVKGAPEIAKNSVLLAELTLKCVSDATGAQAFPVVYRADQTGFNWSESPVVTAELGYLSNPTEDVRLNRSYYQQACAVGLYNGLVCYFGNSNEGD